MSLSNEQLAELIKTGETALMGQLWQQNIGLITKLSRSLYIRYKDHCTKAGTEFDDIKQCAFFALCDAVSAFEAGSGYKLMAYFKYPLKNHFNALVGLRTSKRDPLSACASLDETLSDEQGTTATRADTIPDPAAEGDFDSLIDGIHNGELRRVLDECMATLPPEQSETLIARYYLNKTQDTIAAENGKSRETVRQTERTALKNMGRGENLSRLKSYREYIIDRQLGNSGFTKFKDSGYSCVEWAVEKLLKLEAAHSNGNLPDFYRKPAGKLT